MSEWLDRVDGLLYDGETVETRVEVGEGGVVVTSHRVLAFTPDGQGANFRHVDRPNVGGVERTTRGEFGYLAAGSKALVLGAVLLAAGQSISLDGVVGSIDLTTTTDLGLSGFLRAMQTLLDVLAMLDELVTVAGALGLLAAALLLGAYVRTREDRLVLDVAGDDGIELPIGRDDAATVERLDRAVRPETPAGATVQREETGDPPA